MSAAELAEVKKKIDALETEIAGYVEERKNAITAEERAEATSLINSRSECLTELRKEKNLLLQAPPSTSTAVIAFREEVRGNNSFLIIDEISKEFGARAPANTELYIRPCYKEVEGVLESIVNDSDNSGSGNAVTGVPGIGKSMFLLYFLASQLRSGLTRFWVQTDLAKVKLFQVQSSTSSSSSLNSWRFEFKVTVYNRGDEFKAIGNDLLLVDMAEQCTPNLYAKHIIVFSSPNEARFKEVVKRDSSCLLVMPTWGESELGAVFGSTQPETWRKRMEVVGGVPRLIASPEYLTKIEVALSVKGPKVAANLFSYGHGATDDEQSYALVHCNPPRLDPPKNGRSWDYGAVPVYSIASDYVFLRIFEKQQVAIRTAAVGVFNSGLGSATYGGASAGILFEKLVLWTVPIHEKKLTLHRLPRSGFANLSNAISIEPISRVGQWPLDPPGRAEVGVLYRPTISNFASGDCFCVTGSILIVFQITTAAKHPVKTAGLNKIEGFYLAGVITDRLLVFVTPLNSKLNETQQLTNVDGREKKRKLSGTENEFQQYVCRYEL